tara:strand:+ start:1490 stop:1777 length:288 start_codon:yes stop_codon:yes gene_type:complete
MTITTSDAKYGKVRYTVVESNNLKLGQQGFKVISDTNAHTGTFVAIKVVGGNASVSATSKIGDSISSLTIRQDDIIYGAFSSITLGSGTVLAYYG